MESSESGSPPELDERLLRFRSHPDAADAPGLAEALLGARRATEALEVIEAAHALGGADPRLLVLAGRAWLLEGELLRAQQLLLKAARGMPKDPTPLRWLGEVLLKRGDPDRAAKVLAKALQLAPEDAEVAKRRERAERLARVAASADAEEPPSAPEVEASAPGTPPSPAEPAPPPPSPPKPAVPQPAPPPAGAGPVVPDFELDDDEATRVADAEHTTAPPTDFETDESTVVASDLAQELAQTTREGAAAASPPEPPPAPRPPAPPPPPVLGDDEVDADEWTTAADEPTAFTDMDALPSSVSAAPAAPEAGASPASAAAAVSAPADQGAPTPTTEGARAPLETPEQRPGQVEPDPDAPRAGRRVGRAVLALGVVALLGAGGYHGYLQWTEMRARQATDEVARAHALLLRGDPSGLDAAEHALAQALELDPANPRAPVVRLGLQLQRVFEGGGWDPAALDRVAAQAERAGVAEAAVQVARAAQLVAEGETERARQVLADGADPAADVWVAYATGHLWLRLGDEDAAVSTLDWALEQEPHLHAARLALAEAYVDAGRMEEARGAVYRVREAAPDHLRANLWWAWLTATSEEPTRVVEALDELEPRVDDAAAPDGVLWHLARSRAMARRDDHEAAVDAVERAVALEPSAPRWLARVADRATELGQLALARQVASRAVEAAPHQDDHRMRLARILVMQRDGEAALRALAPLSDRSPEAWALRARAALQVGTPKVLRQASEGLGAHLKDTDEGVPLLEAVHLRMRLALEEDHDLWPDARRLWERAPDVPAVARAVAEVALARGRADTALEALAQALAQQPDDAEAHFLRGRALRMEGQQDAAREALERAVALAPHHAEARLALGRLLLDQGRYTQASEHYGTLMEQDEGRTSHLARLGRVEALAAQGEAEAAAALLAEVPEAQRETPAHRVAAARVAFAQRKGGEAVKQLRPLALADDASADVIASYGDALYVAGDVNAAYDQYERAVAQDESHPEALVGKGRVMVRANKPVTALKRFDEAEEALSKRMRPPVVRARLLTYRGQALLARGDRRGARTALREATAMDGAPAEAYFFLGEALAGRRASEAREAYRAYLDRAPKGPYALRAKRALR